MQFGLLSVLSSYLGLGYFTSQSGAFSVANEDTVYACADCLLERGYKWPFQGHVQEKIGACDMCGKRGVCFDLDDLVPASEDQK